MIIFLKVLFSIECTNTILEGLREQIDYLFYDKTFSILVDNIIINSEEGKYSYFSHINISLKDYLLIMERLLIQLKSSDLNKRNTTFCLFFKLILT